MGRNRKIQVIEGQKFGRLTIIEEVEPVFSGIYKRRRVRAICNCGNYVTINLHSILSGSTKSCGCYGSEVMRNLKSTHGMTGSIEYGVYTGLKSRCNGKDDKDKRYWGRGIKCEWDSFEEFYRDMGDRPGKEYSIERINNDGNYCKDNCKRATASEQSRNRSSNKIYEGKCMLDRAKEKGIKFVTLQARIKKGRGRDRSLNTKVKIFNK